MSSVSFQNSNINQINSPEIQQRLDSKENFTALDKEKLKQDTAEFAKKEIEKSKNGFFGRMINNIGSDNIKKFFTSLALTAGTVFIGAAIANKSSNKMAQLGLNVDAFLNKSNLYKSITSGISKKKESIGNFLKNHSKTIDDISETLKNRKAKQRCNAFRGYGAGFTSIFSLTPVDILKTSLKKAGVDSKNPDFQKAAKCLKDLVGDKNAEKIVEDLYKNPENLTNREICQNLTKYIKDFHGLKNNQELLDFFNKMQKESKFSLFQNVNMKGGPIGGWWPVNVINSIGKKFNKNFSFCRGNLGDSLVKFNVVNGSLAQTGAGKLVQRSLTVPMESITNFVNDKSGMGFFLGLQIFGLYNNVQDAPKGKKAATLADDFVGTMGSIAIATPIAFGATYGLASLKNLKGNGIISTCLKQAGKFFGMGLARYDKAGKYLDAGTSNILIRGAGLALRFGLMMRVFSPMIQKPIYNVIHKVFGKPYDKNEEAQKKLLEEQKNTIIPELGITRGELLEKIQSNPAALQKLQNDPMLLREVGANPKLMLDLLDGKEIKQKPTKLSPATEALLKKQKETIKTPNNLNVSASNEAENNPFSENNPIKEENKNIDTATYIPKSDFIAKSSVSDAKNQELNQAFTKADKVLARAEQFIQ